MIACAMSVLAFAAKGSNDAAQKAQEGDIGHWIDYYKTRQRKPDAQPAPVGPEERGKNSASEQEPTRQRDQVK